MEPKCEYSQLKIPVDFKYSEIAGKFTGMVAAKFGFEETDIQKIVRSTEKAVSWAIDYTYYDNDRGFIEISCEIIPEGFKIAIQDKGLPFDPLLAKTPRAGKLSRLYDLEKDIDEIRLNNLGPGGKEIVLIKYTANRRITDYYDACELNLYDNPFTTRRSASAAISYSVRPMRPDEAVEVSKCIYKGYGYTYSYEHVYYPEKLKELNRTHLLHSAVAVAETGEILGHCALCFETRHDRIAEMGLGVVKPAYRSRGCFNKLTEYLIGKAQKEGLAGIYVQAVTLHIHSQQIALRNGLGECALLLGYIPSGVKFKGLDRPDSQRVSVTLCFRHFDKSVRPKIHPPPHHEKMILAVYAHLGIRPEIGNRSSPGSKIPRHGSAIQIKILNSMRFARIRAAKIGCGFYTEIRTRLKELCLKKIEVISLYLDLSDPLTGSLTQKIEQLGFFFAGILPGAAPAGRDALILQYINNVAIRYEEVMTDSKMAKRLLDYVKGQDPNLT